MSYNTNDNVTQRSRVLGVGGSQEWTHITSDTTLTSDQTRITCAVPASSSITITLPKLNEAVAGRYFDIVCTKDGGGTSVILVDQADAILGAFKAVLINKGDSLRIYSNGYRYIVCAGHRMVTDSGMSATPGCMGDFVFNTSDNKTYQCTVSSATAATWVATT